MDGKQNMKIISKAQLITSIKLQSIDNNRQTANFKRLISSRRSSTPLISTSISSKRKSNNQSNTYKKMTKNNYLSANMQMLTAAKSMKRLSQCKTSSGLRKPKYQQNIKIAVTDNHKLLLKNSDKLQKLYWNQLDSYLQPMIITADFIINQDQFWSEPKIITNIYKQWKQIHKKYFVIWVIRQQKFLRLFKQFTQSQQLPLCAVYYQRRKTKLTVDYCSIKRQLLRTYGSQLKQIIVMENLKMNSRDALQSSTFLGKIPVMLDSRLKICYIRSQSNAQGLQRVIEALKQLSKLESTKIHPLRCAEVYIKNYFQQILYQKQEILRNQLQSLSTRIQTQAQRNQEQLIDEQQAQNQVQKFKKKVLDSIIRQKGIGFQIEGFSVHYIVGDYIKRNYKLLLSNATKSLSIKNQNCFEPKQVMLKENSKQLEIYQSFYQYF